MRVPLPRELHGGAARHFRLDAFTEADEAVLRFRAEVCEWCEQPMKPRANKRFCRPGCRLTAFRKRRTPHV